MQSPVAVFAIWQPILPTDWSRPSTGALRRLSDRRVRQFWDSDHLWSAVLKKAEAVNNIHPDCCERNGFLWDLTAAYAPGTPWNDIPPKPVLLNGPVVNTAGELDSLLTKAK